MAESFSPRIDNESLGLHVVLRPTTYFFANHQMRNHTRKPEESILTNPVGTLAVTVYYECADELAISDFGHLSPAPLRSHPPMFSHYVHAPAS